MELGKDNPIAGACQGTRGRKRFVHWSRGLEYADHCFPNLGELGRFFQLRYADVLYEGKIFRPRGASQEEETSADGRIDRDGLTIKFDAVHFRHVQIEDSQVKLRSAQSRAFNTTDRRRMLEAIVATMQDLGFMIEVLDEDLGIVSGKRFEPLESSPYFNDPYYHLYSDQSLLIFTKSYRTWGPFWHRSDLVRLTITARARNDTQLVVRASAQFYLHAVEDPVPYQKFFRTLEQALFLQGAPTE